MKMDGKIKLLDSVFGRNFAFFFFSSFSLQKSKNNTTSDAKLYKSRLKLNSLNKILMFFYEARECGVSWDFCRYRKF